MKNLIKSFKKILPIKNGKKDNKDSKGTIKLVKGVIFAFFPVTSTIVGQIVKHVKNKMKKPISE